MFCNKSNEILFFSPSWFGRRWPVEPRILQQVKRNIAFLTLFLSLWKRSKTHVLQQVKRNIAFFTILDWAALAGGTSYFATSQMKYCFFDPFSFFVKAIKNSCFATSHTKYCFFDSPFPVYFSVSLAFGPLLGFVFCNKCNGILRFYDFSEFCHFSWKSLLFDANFSFSLFALKPV